MPAQAEARSNGAWQSANGSSTSAEVDGAEARSNNGGWQSANEARTSAEADVADPAWLRLPVIHYALMQGNQQPNFRLATGQHDTRHWLAWEVGCTTPRHCPARPLQVTLR